MKPYKIIEEREVYNAGGRIQIIESDLKTPEGENTTWRFANVPDIAIIFPHDTDGCVHLKNEWRANRREFVWGLPSGMIEDGEAPEEAAQRELQEEVGVRASKLTKLLTIFPTNHIRAQFHIFLAEELVKSTLHGDEHEQLETTVLPFDEAYALVTERQVPTAQDALAFALVARRVRA